MQVRTGLPAPLLARAAVTPAETPRAIAEMSVGEARMVLRGRLTHEAWALVDLEAERGDPRLRHRADALHTVICQFLWGDLSASQPK